MAMAQLAIAEKTKLRDFIQEQLETTRVAFGPVSSLRGEEVGVVLARDVMAMTNTEGGYIYIPDPPSGLTQATLRDQMLPYFNRSPETYYAQVELEATSEEPETRRVGIMYVPPSSADPLIPTKDGIAILENGEEERVFRRGDFFIRRGTQSVRENEAPAQSPYRPARYRIGIQGVEAEVPPAKMARGLLTELEQAATTAARSISEPNVIAGLILNELKQTDTGTTVVLGDDEVTMISVPVGRSLELNRDIQSHNTELGQARETVRKLQKQIDMQGGPAFAPVALLTQKENAEKEVKRLGQRVKVLRAELSAHNRCVTELCIFALLRGDLGIAKGYEVRNVDVLGIADRIYPDIFNRHSILLGLSPLHLASKFEKVESIDNEIEGLKVISADPEAKLLGERFKSLHAGRKMREEGKRYEPGLSLSQVDIDLPRFFDEAESVSIVIGGGWYQRISAPRVSLQETRNAIAIREIHTMGMTRTAIIYYIPWGSAKFSLSDNPDLANTLLQLESRLCNICKKRPCEETSDYRLPNCMLFLRFYDETELFEDRLKANRLLHIPICKVLEAGSITSDYENVLDDDKLHNRSIPDWVFGELFMRKMLGSSWIDSKDLPEIYKVLKADAPDVVFLHSQVYKREE